MQREKNLVEKQSREHEIVKWRVEFSVVVFFLMLTITFRPKDLQLALSCELFIELNMLAL